MQNSHFKVKFEYRKSFIKKQTKTAFTKIHKEKRKIESKTAKN